MDATTDSYAYRCLPLNIANAHGWEILNPCAFEASWDGGTSPDSVEIRLDGGAKPHQAPVSLFGFGTITFHMEGIFRTPEGWNLWVGGSPNQPKDAIAPLGGVIETDWSPYTFTMNWRFTRPGEWIRFEENEPFCFVFPVQRNLLETIEPKLLPIEAEAGLKERFEHWSRSRDALHDRVKTASMKSSESWQKFYYRGNNPDGTPGAADHRSKLRLAAFKTPDGTPLELPQARAGCPMHHRAAPQSGSTALRKREWLLETQERQRSLSPRARTIHRAEGLSREAFLDLYYAASRPLLVGGEMRDWPALQLWNPEYLAGKIGDAPIEYQGGREANASYELDKERHRKVMPFDRFVRTIAAEPSNDAYLTAYNSARNAEALAPLTDDLGFLDKFLTRDSAFPHGMPWIGPAESFTPLHHDLTNNFLCQLVGRKHVKLVPPSETPKLYNDRHVFSAVGDLDAADLASRFPLAASARFYDLVLQPGEILFIPVGWWHQVRALDFSVSMTCTNFIWPNDAHGSFPAD
jgi:hypothetical protein